MRQRPLTRLGMSLQRERLLARCMMVVVYDGDCDHRKACTWVTDACGMQ